jgi:hypothetical protein
MYAPLDQFEPLVENSGGWWEESKEDRFIVLAVMELSQKWFLNV